MMLDNGEIKAIDFNAYNLWYGEPVFETASILHDESVDAVFKSRFKTAYFEDSGLERVDELLLYYKAYHKLAGICEKLWENV